MTKIERVKNRLCSVGLFLRETSIYAINEIIEEECKKSIAKQKENDIIKLVVTLSDVGISESELYTLLSEFWDVDSRREAKKYINIGRHIEWPYHRLKSHLEDEEIPKIDIIKYMKKHKVKDKLKNNPKLCELSIEELKIEVEKL